MYMKRITRIILFIISIISLAACQPTPEKPVIVNKNDGTLEGILSATQPPGEAPEPYETPAHWSETEKGEKLSIAIDADVKLPGVNKYPVVKLEPATFSQQRVDELVSYFAAGRKLYLPHVKTKSDYQQEIVIAKRGQEVDGKFVVDEETEEIVKQLEEQMASAPGESPVIYTDTALKYQRDYETGAEDVSGGKNFLNVMVKNNGGTDEQIAVSNYIDGNRRSISFSYFNAVCGDYYSEEWHLAAVRDIEGNGIEKYKEDMAEEFHIVEYDKLFSEMKYKKEDAQAKADKAISDLGIEDLALVKADKSVSLKYPDKSAYVFEYMRQSGGINGFSISGGGGREGEQPPQYSPPFQLEELSILVTEDGIQEFSWSGVSKVVETVSENVKLLPFEQIQQDLKDQIKYKKSFFDADAYRYKNYTVKVVSAELRMGYIDVKDNPGQALMVPVWVLDTKESYQLDLTGVKFEHDGDQYVLNAIDGGVIELRY